MREKILDIAEEMVQKRGFNAVSFQHLADTAGIRKPSVFHHFANKDNLARALIERCSGRYATAFADLSDSNLLADQKLRQIADLFAADLDRNRLCLLSVMGGSVATLTAPARGELSQAIAGAVSILARIIAQGRSDGTLTFTGDSRDAATAFLAMMQGTQILARAQSDPEVFRRSVESSIQSIS